MFSSSANYFIFIQPQCIKIKMYMKQRILYKITYWLITGILFQSISTACIIELKELWPCNTIKEKSFSFFGLVSQYTYFLYVYHICAYKHEVCIYIAFSFILTFHQKKTIPEVHVSTLVHNPSRRNTLISFSYSYWSIKLDRYTSDIVLNFPVASSVETSRIS